MGTRRYDLVDYSGHPEAERVVVVTGSGGCAIAETVEQLVARGERVGMVQVRLYRPFPSTPSSPRCRVDPLGPRGRGGRSRRDRAQHLPDRRGPRPLTARGGGGVHPPRGDGAGEHQGAGGGEGRSVPPPSRTSHGSSWRPGRTGWCCSTASTSPTSTSWTSRWSLGWMHEREYASVEQLKGSVSQLAAGEPEAFERANYMRTLTTYSSTFMT